MISTTLSSNTIKINKTFKFNALRLREGINLYDKVFDNN